ncbi:amino acid ABC transporter substrate-binding protein [Aliikangiella marina]|uniref:Amino acid ABC transporter substrate-binding protein n=1 Tax=Aliikangiella marina TaxID=1712262 RepID=A0A545TA17_9GAMM|nr:transporter substrate-binding domain-containing protein [Aliikangiella marina]TQV74044.1 amino acid ABC transporter substrate-binding protein [Aliikangiella marina]
MRKLVLLLGLLTTFSMVVNSKELSINYVPPENLASDSHAYFVDLLTLALEKTRNIDGDFTLKPLAFHMVQSRAIQELAKGNKVDVYWTMTSLAREKKLLPIRVPLLKGLFGYRIFLIREEDRQKFASINSLDELKLLVAGQGSDWPDTKILRANGFDVVGITDYDSIFPMLQRRRVDFVPRGISEPWGEVKRHQDKNLIVEETIMLQYPAPMYFFVNQENTALSERIEKGLNIAIEDGSFEKLFLSHPGSSEILAKANIENRKIFRLNNPVLPPETPINNKKFWISVD